LEPYFKFRQTYEQQNIRAKFAGTVFPLRVVQRIAIAIQTHIQLTAIISLQLINESDHKENTNKSLSFMTENLNRLKKHISLPSCCSITNRSPKNISVFGSKERKEKKKKEKR